jgi:hypothetical protein
VGRCILENIARVKVDLAKQLPSRLTTLRKACPDSTFNQNPACVWSALLLFDSAAAITPIIPVPLSGPVYFVSHGGVAFPELIVVLQGNDVTVQLHGETFINERIATHSGTFGAIPDAPIRSAASTWCCRRVRTRRSRRTETSALWPKSS